MIKEEISYVPFFMKKSSNLETITDLQQDKLNRKETSIYEIHRNCYSSLSSELHQN